MEAKITYTVPEYTWNDQCYFSVYRAKDFLIDALNGAIALTLRYYGTTRLFETTMSSVIVNYLVNQMNLLLAYELNNYCREPVYSLVVGGNLSGMAACDATKSSQ